MQAQPGCRKPTPALKSPYTPAAPTHNAHPTRRDGHPTTDHTLRRSRSRQPTKVHLACEQRHTPSSPVTKPPRPWRHRFPTPPAPRRNGINPGDVAAPRGEDRAQHGQRAQQHPPSRQKHQARTAAATTTADRHAAAPNESRSGPSDRAAVGSTRIDSSAVQTSGEAGAGSSATPARAAAARATGARARGARARGARAARRPGRRRGAPRVRSADAGKARRRAR